MQIGDAAGMPSRIRQRQAIIAEGSPFIFRSSASETLLVHGGTSPCGGMVSRGEPLVSAEVVPQ
jgi:hypothetical protein